MFVWWVMVSLSNHSGQAFTHALRRAQGDPALYVISPSEALDFKTRNDGDFYFIPTFCTSIGAVK
jgi:hypothetical protein